MQERRRVMRRQSDRELYQRIQDLEMAVDRRGSHQRSDEAEHNRRRTIRHDCQVAIEMLMRYSAGGLDTWNVETMKIKGRLLDLSHGGASLFTGQRFEIGQELRLMIRLHDRTDIHSSGKVRWVKDVPQKNGYMSGVQFDSISKDDVQKLGKYLKQLDETFGLA